jgi:hypothetical protein
MKARGAFIKLPALPVVVVHDSLRFAKRMSSLIKNFPEDILSRKSLLLLGFAHRFALLVGFGFVAA